MQDCQINGYAEKRIQISKTDISLLQSISKLYQLHTSIKLAASSASRWKNCSGQSLVGGILLPYPRGSHATSVNCCLLKCSNCCLKSVCEQPDKINMHRIWKKHLYDNTRVWIASTANKWINQLPNQPIMMHRYNSHILLLRPKITPVQNSVESSQCRVQRLCGWRCVSWPVVVRIKPITVTLTCRLIN